MDADGCATCLKRGDSSRCGSAIDSTTSACGFANQRPGRHTYAKPRRRPNPIWLTDTRTSHRPHASTASRAAAYRVQASGFPAKNSSGVVGASSPRMGPVWPAQSEREPPDGGSLRCVWCLAT